MSTFDPRPTIRRLGKPGAKPLEPDEARALFSAMIGRTIDDVQLGAAWMGMRIKGETPEELLEFLAVAEASCAHWDIGAVPDSMPVVIPSYNGARQLPNLTPLLAMLLARRGVRVVVHGVTADPTRVTSADVFAAMGIAPSPDPAAVTRRHADGLPAFVSIATLAPALAALLERRWTIGARGSIHTIVKMFNPLADDAIRLVSVTHPDYVDRMRACFANDRAGVLLLRGAEGEAVAHPRRALRMEILGGPARENVLPVAAAANAADAADPRVIVTEAMDDVALPAGCDAATTAEWIGLALRGEVPVPPSILRQVEACARAARGPSAASAGAGAGANAGDTPDESSVPGGGCGRPGQPLVGAAA